jgi:choline monooxygenase
MPHPALEQFDPSRPIEDAVTPPYTWYTEESFLEEEKRLIFQRAWIPVGRIDQVQKPGDYITGEVVGNPWVIVRAEDGQLYAHHNACRHKGAAVAQEHGSCASFVCPYHGWEYHHNGRLKKAPHLGRQVSFDPQRWGLLPAAVDTWGPFVFIDLDASFGGRGNPRNLHTDLAPIKGPLEELGFGNLRWFERREYFMNCNWKVFVDNSLDGGYHVAYAHEGLAEGLDFAGYETISGPAQGHPRTAIQVCNTSGTDQRLGAKVIYAWMFPNFFINRYGNMMDTNIVLPISANRCKVVFDFYFDFDNFEVWESKKRIRQSIADSHVIQQEDIEICESAQRGMHSMAWHVGRYSSTLERAVHDFHVLLWREMSGFGDA